MKCNQQFIIFVFSLFILIQNAESASRIDPLVDTKLGLIRGLRATHGEYAMFLGIPYANLNESNAFGQSIPHTGFDGTFEAFDGSAICPQDFRSGGPIGKLDCLHLNIYVPNVASSANRLPVMVWIHGGAFTEGYSSRFQPSYLMSREVIVVTINYRVGPYGFMCLNSPEVPGNQGLRDQHLALKWVKNNIEAFGGNDNQITIFGASAGGVSVDLQLFFSDDNLFNKVIMQSGSALYPWGVVDSDISAPFKLAEHLGLKTNDLDEALSFLTTVDTNLVIAATTELSINFKPCVERPFDNVKAFIYDHPLNLHLPRVKNIPILAGFNDEESLKWVVNRSPEEQKSVIIDFIKQYLNFKPEEVAEVEEVIRHFYLGDDEINESKKQAILEFDSDFTFNHPMIRSLRKHLYNGAPAIYQYLFTYNGAYNIGKQPLNVTTSGAAHNDELGYIFQFTDNEIHAAEDQLIIDRMTTLWTNFAKFGNPTPTTSDILPVIWPQLTKDTLPYMHIDSEIAVESRPFHDRMAFWDLFYKLYYKAQWGYRDEE